MTVAEFAPVPDGSALEVQASDAASVATAIIVRDEASSNRASQTLNAIRDLRKEAADVFDPVVRTAYAAHKAAVAAKKKIDGPLAEAQEHLTNQIATWMDAERAAREAEAALEALEAGEDAALDEDLAVSVEGQTVRATWSAEVTDVMALVKAIADGTVTPEAIVPNTKFLNQMARAMRENLKWPGVRAVKKTSLSRARD